MKGSAEELDHEVAAAFTHFSFANSKGTGIVCDLQGVGTTWTDVQINSLAQEGYGQSDMGRQGMKAFFASHACNSLCRALKISGAWMV
ncbi:kinase-like domain-containing protein [Dunaliella salina]|uniref:Kinase-like domain-containing protein n=1 Tax=Dunaliella salina TaxID=3046 RepID=A0ABQ7GBD6_DUNSA|nr:kinase-like domain-containing protein [Dunaliella salina]|eukprot:KAF5831931.1 kinase-like domain-containing protein [Dunaliella salina]